MALTAKESIQASIDNLALDGAASTIYLDPIAMRVYDFPVKQNAVPVDVHNRIDVSIITVGDRASDTSVKAALTGVIDKLVDYAATFIAVDDSGKGVWDDDADYYAYDFIELTADITYGSDPSDWFEGENHQIVRKYMLGMSYSDIVSTYDLGDEYTGWCDEGDALAHVKWVVNTYFSDGSFSLCTYDDDSNLTLYISGITAYLHINHDVAPSDAINDLHSEFYCLPKICTLGEWQPHDDGGMTANLIPIAL